MDDEKVNILVVDDLEEKLLVYETILGGLGQNLVKARSGGRRCGTCWTRSSRSSCSTCRCRRWTGSRRRR